MPVSYTHLDVYKRQENLFWLFAVAGNETTRNGMPGGLVGLLGDPAAQRALRDDPSLIPNAVEEMPVSYTHLARPGPRGEIQGYAVRASAGCSRRPIPPAERLAWLRSGA